jgi:beta-lactamase class D
MTHWRLYLIIAVVFFAGGCKNKTCIENRNDFAKYYSEYRLSGSFVLYDLKKDQYTYYNQAQAKQAYPPGGTFKLFLSLVGFETGNINTEGSEAPDRMKTVWKHEHDRNNKYQNSTVYYYDELSRKIGAPAVKGWMDKVAYGNADTTGGVPAFWQTGGLKISPEEQVGFLRKLYEHRLPFSVDNMDKVKSMMAITDTTGYSIKGKTGWAEQDNQDIGWYVGYIETKDDTYFFANCVQSSDPGNPYFENARVDIVNKILRNLGVIAN